MKKKKFDNRRPGGDRRKTQLGTTGHLEVSDGTQRKRINFFRITGTLPEFRKKTPLIVNQNLKGGHITAKGKVITSKDTVTTYRDRRKNERRRPPIE